MAKKFPRLKMSDPVISSMLDALLNLFAKRDGYIGITKMSPIDFNQSHDRQRDTSPPRKDF